MHDLDRALQEFEFEAPALESYESEQDEAAGEYEGEDEYETGAEYEGEAEDEYESDAEYEADAEYDGEGDFELEQEQDGEYQLAPQEQSEAIFDEMEQMEQAAALLEVQDEGELEQFLGGLIGKVTKKLQSVLPAGVRKALAGTLGKVVKVALPKVGFAAGNMIVPGVGGILGSAVASNAGKMFGLELEGMSYEDQEFEVARRIVSLGAEATKVAAEAAPVGGTTIDTAKQAVVQAAQTHAPGLASAVAGPRYMAGASPRLPRRGPRRRTGRWYRRGRRIVLVGL